ncbi:Rne/Rng family ribonuclease [Thermonema rossianum]|uniref:Rne/Rng family ribonuclease n=1 Tax=Thermonema rossianum TaxID=55505 RepID=UPI000570D7D8|nr:Rne/Rng family ribonuclease [Thermonema rossianum]
MSHELIVNVSKNSVRIALLNDKDIIEYHVVEGDNPFNVGDIYFGTVKKVVSGHNAAFIDVGYEKDAFLHYTDLGPNVRTLLRYTKDTIAKRQKTHKLDNIRFEEPIEKGGKIGQVLKRNMPILVQIEKEPISNKGPRLSCQLTIAGRYLVLIPFADTVNVSKKIIKKEERNRLLRLINSIKPKNFGVIVRTAAEGKEVAELDADLRELMERWEAGYRILREARPPAKIIGELSRVSAILRDMLDENFDAVVVDDPAMYEEIRSYIRRIAPDREKIVKLYNGKVGIFEHYGIEKQLKQIFGKSVSLPGGGYLIIEHTEALHVIDVNSGNQAANTGNQEETALKVNLEAAKEIARQLRIRDMGGIIVIDFIDMKNPAHKKAVYEAMKEFMKSDRARHTILPITRFGLMQITRERVRPELNIKTREVCPACNGTGSISASILIADAIENALDYIVHHQKERGLSLIVHPYLHAYFTKGLWSKQMKWFFKYGTWVRVIPDSSLAINEYKFKNKKGIEIET